MSSDHVVMRRAPTFVAKSAACGQFRRCPTLENRYLCRFVQAKAISINNWVMSMMNGGMTQGQVGKSLDITVHTISAVYPAILRDMPSEPRKLRMSWRRPDFDRVEGLI